MAFNTGTGMNTGTNIEQSPTAELSRWSYLVHKIAGTVDSPVPNDHISFSNIPAQDFWYVLRNFADQPDRDKQLLYSVFVHSIVSSRHRIEHRRHLFITLKVTYEDMRPLFEWHLLKNIPSFPIRVAQDKASLMDWLVHLSDVPMLFDMVTFQEIVLSTLNVYEKHTGDISTLFDALMPTKRTLLIPTIHSDGCDYWMKWSSGIFSLRNGDPYPRSPRTRFCPSNTIDTFRVPYWNAPCRYSSMITKTPMPWADSIENVTTFKYNQMDGPVDRRSHTGVYGVDNNGWAINPMGYTGIKGPGELGRIGPNHAADPVVVDILRDEAGEAVYVNIPSLNVTLPAMRFIGIQRKDNGEWAIPGGMVDPGETVNKTLIRELTEEALGDTERLYFDPIKEAGMNYVRSLFSTGGIVIYRGIMDDPRNTDNAWIETTASVFICKYQGKINPIDAMGLKNGDDESAVDWVPFYPGQDLKLYAGHEMFVFRAYMEFLRHFYNIDNTGSDYLSSSFRVLKIGDRL